MTTRPWFLAPWFPGLLLMSVSVWLVRTEHLPGSPGLASLASEFLLGTFFIGLFLALGGPPRRYANTIGTTLMILGCLSCLALVAVNVVETLGAEGDIRADVETLELHRNEILALNPKIEAIADPFEKEHTFALRDERLAEIEREAVAYAARRRSKAAESATHAAVQIILVAAFAAGAWWLYRERSDRPKLVRGL